MVRPWFLVRLSVMTSVILAPNDVFPLFGAPRLMELFSKGYFLDLPSKIDRKVPYCTPTMSRYNYGLIFLAVEFRHKSNILNISSKIKSTIENNPSYD